VNGCVPKEPGATIDTIQVIVSARAIVEVARQQATVRIEGSKRMEFSGIA